MIAYKQLFFYLCNKTFYEICGNVLKDGGVGVKKYYIIIFEIFLCVFLIACSNEDDEIYRISGDDVYATLYECGPEESFYQSFFIIENDNDLKEILNQYDKFLEQPGFNNILEKYPFEMYTIFIDWTRTNNRIDSISQDAVLVEKKTGRVYTECKLNFYNDEEDIKYWVMYWVVKKEILKDFDFTDQKNEPYEYRKKPNGGIR